MTAPTTPAAEPIPSPAAGTTPPLITVVVYGTPGPQGSKRHVGDGRLIESSKKVAPWRASVRQAAVEATDPACAALGLVEWEPLDQPLIVEMAFTLHRGKTVKRPHHTTYPDLSKLIRSTEDALTAAGIWADDARVVRYHNPRKLYVGDTDPDALLAPGVVIRIWAVTP
ncbi:RusA family crossover junction endodeoxyribonuclease [Streptosporangium sp. NPDC001559]|uniref:RusA family crossover junction endodeoxyribonuclease n=1 Tax=Streptosporangium sp. NPDC001559 TaxID=3366187 RepID=UPI0036E29E68